MSDDTISTSAAAAMLATDNKGQPVFSPTERMRIEQSRLGRAAWLEQERTRLLAEIAELKATWQDRVAAEVSLRMRGRAR